MPRGSSMWDILRDENIPKPAPKANANGDIFFGFDFATAETRCKAAAGTNYSEIVRQMRDIARENTISFVRAPASSSSREVARLTEELSSRLANDTLRTYAPFEWSHLLEGVYGVRPGELNVLISDRRREARTPSFATHATVTGRLRFDPYLGGPLPPSPEEPGPSMWDILREE